MVQPTISALQRHKLIPAYVSNELVDWQVTQLFESKARNQIVIGTDFSHFDQSFNECMQSAGKNIWEYLLTSSPSADNWMVNIYPCAFEIPLLCTGKAFVTGKHGMASGSGQTNTTECFSHKSLQFEVARADKEALNPYSMAYGDDALLTYPGISVEKVTRSYTSHGLEMNLDKQYASTEDCIFLRRWHSKSYYVEGIMAGVYPTYRALGRLLAQERWYDPDIWNAKMVTLRAWSILENCKFHPLFHEFVDFVIKGDKYKLGLSIPGFFDEVGSLSQKAVSQIPDFLGYTKTLQGDAGGGVENWAIFKYLASKAKG